MKKMNLYQMATIAIMSALMCILGPLSVPIGPIPVTLTNLVVYLAIFLLGAKGATMSVILYLLLGLVGLPVFSGFQGGVGKLVGPTGGYLIGFIFVAIIAGLISEKTNYKVVISFLGLLLATAVLYTFGTIWFIFEMKCDFAYAMSACVLPFIPFDVAKMVVATILGKAIRAALKKANLLPEERA